MRRRRGCIAALVLACASIAGAQETPQQWYRAGREAVERAKSRGPVTGKARNVILFLGDGMGFSTVTAARILEGQQRGQPGEENRLSFETLPYTGIIKTYNTNQQTPDSAGTMSALVTGIKTRAGVLSLDQNVVRGSATSARDHVVPTIVELAERAGLATGVVTTASVTHATPGACYAHSPERNWESDASMPADALAAGFSDIARQLVAFPVGDGLEVALGGGRKYFLPTTQADPEDAAQTGVRRDGRDLTAEWLARPGSAFVWNRKQLEAIDVTKTDHLLALFSSGYMAFEHDREKDAGGEPSLSEMTAAALKLLARNKKGFFLMVEGGRIDHAHHNANAYRALTETIELARAVRVAMAATDRRETLIVVTADHSHALTMVGYGTRGNPILGKVRLNDLQGNPTQRLALDGFGLPYTTLIYAMGPGHVGPTLRQAEGAKSFPHSPVGYLPATHGRPDLTESRTEDPDYLVESALPGVDAPHSGVDVPLYADGPQAHLLTGVLEQNVIFHVMVEALGLAPEGPTFDRQ